MKTRLLDMQDDVNFDAKNPTIDRLYYVTECDPLVDTLETVVLKVMYDSPGYLSFKVPNSDTFVPALLQTVVYRKALKPAWLSAKQATCLVKYGNLDAAPHESQGGRKPGDKPGSEICGPEFSFDTTGSTVKIVRALKTIEHNVCDGSLVHNTAPLIPGDGIGYLDGKFEGVDIVTGQIKWSMTLKGVPVTPKYIKKLAKMTGKTNSDIDWMGFEDDEVLFLGASGNFRAGDGWVVTYNFMAGETKYDVYFPHAEDENRTKFNYVGPFDYVWARYKEVEIESDDESFVVAVPASAYLQRVYDRVSFDDLFTAA